MAPTDEIKNRQLKEIRAAVEEVAGSPAFILRARGSELPADGISRHAIDTIYRAISEPSASIPPELANFSLVVGDEEIFRVEEGSVVSDAGLRSAIAPKEKRPVVAAIRGAGFQVPEGARVQVRLGGRPLKAEVNTDVFQDIRVAFGEIPEPSGYARKAVSVAIDGKTVFKADRSGMIAVDTRSPAQERENVPAPGTESALDPRSLFEPFEREIRDAIEGARSEIAQVRETLDASGNDRDRVAATVSGLDRWTRQLANESERLREELPKITKPIADLQEAVGRDRDILARLEEKIAAIEERIEADRASIEASVDRLMEKLEYTKSFERSRPIAFLNQTHEAIEGGLKNFRERVESGFRDLVGGIRQRAVDAISEVKESARSKAVGVLLRAVDRLVKPESIQYLGDDQDRFNVAFSLSRLAVEMKPGKGLAVGGLIFFAQEQGGKKELIVAERVETRKHRAIAFCDERGDFRFKGSPEELGQIERAASAALKFQVPVPAPEVEKSVERENPALDLD
jgi:hypothetical protein